MSDSPFSFQDEETSAISPLDSDEGSSRRTLVVLGALGAVVLAAAAYFLLGGEEPADEEVAFPTGTRAPQVQAPVPPGEPVTVPEAADPERSGVNPFKVLILEPVAAPAAPPPSAAPTPAALPVIVVTNDTGPTGTTTTVATSPAPKTPAPAPAPSPVVSTVSFTGVTGSAPVGTFHLDDTSYTAAKGEDFGGKVRVVDLRKNLEDAWVAVLQVGDGTPFDVYEDQQVVIP